MEDNVIMDENPIVTPVVDAPVDTTIEDTTLAPTDEVIPAPACDCGGSCCGECDTVTVGGFFGTLQECVTIVWQFHLKTRKHFVHVELNDFYKQALDDVDDIIEQYQGINGVVDEPYVNCIVGNGKTEITYLNELKNFIECNKHILGNNSEINSTIDNFLGHIDSILYKLTNLTEKAVKSFEEFCYEELTERCCYDRFGERTCDDPEDDDYDPEMENGECCGEEEE